MNATLQCLRPIPELREALTKYQGAPSADLSHNFVAGLRDTFAQMDLSVDSIPPMQFVDAMRRAYPQFAQQTPRGGFMQQVERIYDTSNVALSYFE